MIVLLNYYIYRFLDADNNIIYIGKTNNIKRRIEGQHFSHRSHLPEQCYAETRKIEYSQFKSSTMMSMYEIFLINKHSPAHNKEFNHRESMGIELPELSWVEYMITDNMRRTNTPEHDNLRQADHDAYTEECWRMCFAALGGGL